MNRTTYSRFDVLQTVDLLSDTLTPELQQWFSERRILSFWIDGTNIIDAATLFAQAAIDIPQPKECVARGWPGLIDNLRSLLYSVDAAHVVVVWTHAERMLNGGLRDLLVAADVFADLAKEVVNDREHYKTVRQFSALLLGKGNNFK